VPIEAVLEVNSRVLRGQVGMPHKGVRSVRRADPSILELTFENFFRIAGHLFLGRRSLFLELRKPRRLEAQS